MSVPVVTNMRETILKSCDFASASSAENRPVRAIISVRILALWGMNDSDINRLDCIMAWGDRCVAPSHSSLRLWWINRE